MHDPEQKLRVWRCPGPTCQLKLSHPPKPGRWEGLKAHGGRAGVRSHCFPPRGRHRPSPQVRGDGTPLLESWWSQRPRSHRQTEQGTERPGHLPGAPEGAGPGVNAVPVPPRAPPTPTPQRQARKGGWDAATHRGLWRVRAGHSEEDHTGGLATQHPLCTQLGASPCPGKQGQLCLGDRLVLVALLRPAQLSPLLPSPPQARPGGKGASYTLLSI